jgi:hypothetical protein
MKELIKLIRELIKETRSQGKAKSEYLRRQMHLVCRGSGSGFDLISSN